MERHELQYMEMVVALLFLGECDTFSRVTDTSQRRVQAIALGLDEAHSGWRREAKSRFLPGDGSAPLVRLLVHLADRGTLTREVARAIHIVLGALNPTRRHVLDQLHDARKFRDRVRTLNRRYPFLALEYRDPPSEPEERQT